jgi:hypothetical protein
MKLQKVYELTENDIVTLPDIVDGGLADSLTGCHQPATPLGHSVGFAT